MDSIKIAIVGVGNCASSLLQGIEYYRGKSEDAATGLMYWNLGGYLPSGIEVAAAFDIDARKVGKDVAEAIFSPPNCTTVFCPGIPRTGVTVRMGRVLDGFPEHMQGYKEECRFVLADEEEEAREDVVRSPVYGCWRLFSRLRVRLCPLHHRFTQRQKQRDFERKNTSMAGIRR